MTFVVAQMDGYEPSHRGRFRLVLASRQLGLAADRTDEKTGR